MKILSEKSYRAIMAKIVRLEDSLRESNIGATLKEKVLRGSIGDWRANSERLEKMMAKKDDEIQSLKRELEKTRKLNRHLECEIERMKGNQV